MKKLAGVKQKIKGWNKEVFKDIDIRREELQNQILLIDSKEGTTDWSVDLFKERKERKAELEELISRKKL